MKVIYFISFTVSCSLSLQALGFDCHITCIESEQVMEGRDTVAAKPWLAQFRVV